MAFVVAAGFGRIVMTSLLDQTNNQVMHSSQDTSRSADRHADGIFTESNITAIVQASFDKLMLGSELEHFSRGCLRLRKAGDAELDLTVCFEDSTFALVDGIPVPIGQTRLRSVCLEIPVESCCVTASTNVSISIVLPNLQHDS